MGSFVSSAGLCWSGLVRRVVWVPVPNIRYLGPDCPAHWLCDFQDSPHPLWASGSFTCPVLVVKGSACWFSGYCDCIRLVLVPGSSAARDPGGVYTCDGSQIDALCAQEAVESRAWSRVSRSLAGSSWPCQGSLSGKKPLPLLQPAHQRHLAFPLSLLLFAFLPPTLLPMPCPGWWL